jgi:hypothetical protein
MGKKIITFVSRVSGAFDVFNLKGQAIVGLFTLVVIGLSIYVTITGKDIPGGVVMAYGSVITGLVVNTTFKAPQGTTKAEK